MWWLVRVLFLVVYASCTLLSLGLEHFLYAVLDILQRERGIQKRTNYPPKENRQANRKKKKPSTVNKGYPANL